MAWRPTDYLAFADHRRRPAQDLLARLPKAWPRPTPPSSPSSPSPPSPHAAMEPQTLLDLGCGAGNVSALLAARWPEVRLIGVDGDAAMLARAQKEGPAQAEWIQADIATWSPSHPVDLLFSNAALHWLPNHDALLPRLLNWLTPGGILAVQMPRNFLAPSHTSIIDVATQRHWKEAPGQEGKLAALLARPVPVDPPQTYYNRLAPLGPRLDLWETEYLQLLEGEDPVAAWTKGTWLRPFLEAIHEDERPQFEQEYKQILRTAYPKSQDGKTPFPFKRLFLIAYT